MSAPDKTGTSTRVVVIGGGYAGVMAANRLTRRDDVGVTLINPRPGFVERIRLHQLVAGNYDAVADFASVLADRVELVVDTADRIDAAEQRIELSSGGTLEYDYLIYAVGSTGAVPAGVPGAQQFGHPISELEHAQRLQARLDDLPISAPVVVVGAGLTGIETATELAQTGRQVSIVSDSLAPSLHANGRRSVAKQLSRLGIDVIDGVTVASVESDLVRLGDGREVPSAVTVWTVGFGVPGLAAASGLTTDVLGRLITDETLTSVDDSRILAAGDAASPSDSPYRMSCQAALPLGAQAANTVLSRMAGDRPRAVSQAMSAQCISLGRDVGTLQLSSRDDTPRRFYLGGRAAGYVKEQICRKTVSWLRDEAAEPGSYTWIKGPSSSRTTVMSGPQARQR